MAGVKPVTRIYGSFNETCGKMLKAVRRSILKDVDECARNSKLAKLNRKLVASNKKLIDERWNLFKENLS